MSIRKADTKVLLFGIRDYLCNWRTVFYGLQKIVSERSEITSDYQNENVVNKTSRFAFTLIKTIQVLREGYENI